VLQGKTKNGLTAVLGYGSQGKAIAHNLRDSGYRVIIGLRQRSRSREKARRDGFRAVYTVKEAAKKAACICFALPDHLQGRIFSSDIEKNLEEGRTLLFLHGFSVHFGFVLPPERCDVIMVAPHAPGLAVREMYLTDRSLSAFYAVYQNYTGTARKTALALASAMGFKRTRLVPTTFEDEAVGDLFGEQAVLCGGLSELILNGFEVLVEKGLSPENAYLEVAYQLDRIIYLIKQYGMEGMYDRISATARYGSTLSGQRIIDRSVRKRMESLYEDIKSGKFAHRLDSLKPSDMKNLRQQIKRRIPRSFEKAARKYAK
jgi:ketol-acid reductoisomerase